MYVIFIKILYLWIILTKRFCKKEIIYIKKDILLNLKIDFAKYLPNNSKFIFTLSCIYLLYRNY